MVTFNLASPRRSAAFVALVFVSHLPVASPMFAGTPAGNVRCSARIDEAQALSKAGKNDDARKVLTLAIRACTPPKSIDEKKSLAVAHTKLGALLYDQSAAQSLFHSRKAMDLDPDNVKSSLNAGAALIKLGQYKEAISILEAAIKHGTEDTDVGFKLEYNAGFAFTKLCVEVGVANCDAARGEQHFLRASEVNPGIADTYFQLAAFANDFHRDSRRAMQLFKKSCDLGEEAGCFQYNAFKAQFDRLEQQKRNDH
jgi:tetratricopeptide (TPR) repeat protein